MVGGSPRILIVRLSAIGDVVRVLPVLQILRDAYPEAHLDWVIERKSVEVIQGHPSLDGVLIFERPKKAIDAVREFMGLCRSVRDNHYDIVLDFHGILKSGLLTWYSGAKDRIGFSRPRSQEGSFLCTNRKARLPKELLNRCEENHLLCRALLPDCGWGHPIICVPIDVQTTVDDFFEATFDGGKRVIALHAPMDRPEKQWPIEHCARLSDLLLSDGRFEVVLTWGPGQLEVVREVISRAKRMPTVGPETPDLKHLAWVLYRADCYVGGDTGPMHIAWAMGTPVVAIFGGTDPRQHAPFQQPHLILADSQAGACDLATARKRLQSITPESAYEACLQLLTRGPANGGETSGPR
ncbi:MAG: glycosyltransferase family 9 protein [Candidatus Hydrogenedentes bacterium]|nr:glycosyltransferase family 9 protein [Candidatus Hydrogenedentota bacterium]